MTTIIAIAQVDFIYSANLAPALINVLVFNT